MTISNIVGFPGTPKPNDGIAVLVGNGLSIAFSRELAIPKLTSAIEGKFNEAAGADAEAAEKLAELVQDMPRSDAMSDFEALLGPLDEMGEQLGSVERIVSLAPYTVQEVAKVALTDVRAAIDQVRRIGVGHVLEVIDQRAYAEISNTVVETFMAKVFEASHRANIAIANLNYDNLVASSLLRLDAEMCDMARGSWSPPKFEIGDYGIQAEGLSLRRSADFLPTQVRLLHLHGSVSWLRHPSGLVYKFKIEDVRTAKFWDAWRNGRTDWSPVVVLTNQRSKKRLVAGYPFKLGYEEFERQLIVSDRWLIAGYSFRDETVNEMLKRAFWTRMVLGRPPQLLVVTHEDDLKNKAVLDSLGYSEGLGHPQPKTWMRITRKGIESATKFAYWDEWANGGWSSRAAA